MRLGSNMFPFVAQHCDRQERLLVPGENVRSTFIWRHDEAGPAGLFPPYCSGSSS